MTAAHNRRLVRRMVEDVWNRGDLALADVLVAPGYVNHGGLIPDVAHGPEAIKVAVALYRTAFPTFHITVEALVAEGAMVELQWAARRSPRRGPVAPVQIHRGRCAGRRAVALPMIRSWRVG